MYISIIIPTLNEEHHIGATITQIRRRASRGDTLQIIVADGGSTDQTRAAAREAGAHVITVDRARRSIQLNAGASEASGDILYFLHADTVPPRQFDTHIINSVSEGCRAGCFQLSFDDNHPLLQFYGWCTRFNIDTFRFGDQSLFVEKKLFKKSGGYRRDHVLLEDQEIVRRLKTYRTFAILPALVTTSSRKYQKNGALRLQLIYAAILMLYKAGLSQPKLYSFYKKRVQ